MPLVSCLLPLSGIVLSMAAASGVAENSRGQELRRLLTIHAIVSVAILSAANFVALLFGLRQGVVG